MSTVTKIDCVVCTPSAGDLQGIRRPIAGGITSEELYRLIAHVAKEHQGPDAYAVADLALQKAEEALGLIKSLGASAPTSQTVQAETEFRVSEVPATLPANSGETLRVMPELKDIKLFPTAPSGVTDGN